MKRIQYGIELTTTVMAMDLFIGWGSGWENGNWNRTGMEWIGWLTLGWLCLWVFGSAYGHWPISNHHEQAATLLSKKKNP